MTTGPSYERVFDRLRGTVSDWAELLTMEPSLLSGLIADGGLANQKAPRMLAIARGLQETFGRVTLDPLGRMADGEAEAFLTTLPGVGAKTAKCILMYSLGRAVLPVDTHVTRVSRRLNLAAGFPAAKYASALEAEVPADCRYDYHVNALAHGRAVCRPKRPKCGECPIRALCPSADAA